MEKQNKERILNKIDELLELIRDTDDYKRYTYLKEELKKNSTLMNLINDIKKLEQKRIKFKYNKEPIDEIELEIENKRKELNSFPNYVEYTYLQEDLNNMFQNIKNIIELNIN